MLPAREMKRLALLRAFALARSGADPASVTAALALARPILPSIYEGLAASWPELREFAAAST